MIGQEESSKELLAYGKWDFLVCSEGLSTKLLISTTIGVAWAVLHNLSLILNDNLEEEEKIKMEI